MKYAIPDSSKRLTNTVDIPDPLPSWADDPLAFLTKMFPDHEGWILVSDDNLTGATDNGDGTYKNPELIAEPEAEAVEPTRAALLAKVKELIASVPALIDAVAALE